MQIRDRIWAGEYWSEKGAIRLAELRLEVDLVEARTTPDEAEAYSLISKIYFLAARNAATRFKRAPLWAKPSWAFRALRYWRKAHRCSGRVEALMGLWRMTSDQLHTWSNILRSSGSWSRAIRCAEVALARPNLRPELRFFLLVGKAEALDHKEKYAEAERALIAASTIEPEMGVEARVRFHRAFGEHCERSENLLQSRRYYETALRIARTADGLDDEEWKIRIRLKRLEEFWP